MALRGHASIQGSTDIPTLYNILPGYLPMPHVDARAGPASVHRANTAPTRLAGASSTRTSSRLLKAWWGEAATDGERLLLRLPAADRPATTRPTGRCSEMLDGKVEGYIVVGENPAVGIGERARRNRLALAKLDWLVVRDLVEIETASFWYDSPEIESGELKTEEIATEVFFLPAAAHTSRRTARSRTRSGCCSGTTRRSSRRATAARELWFYYHLGRLIREKLADSTTTATNRPMLRPDLALPDVRRDRGAERGGGAARDQRLRTPTGRRSRATSELKADGSTACGCWIYCGVYADGTNQAARRKPHWEQSYVAPEWGWAWPANRRHALQPRRPPTPTASRGRERKRYVWWDAEQRHVDRRRTSPTSTRTSAPDYVPPDGANGPDAIARRPPVHHAGRRARLAVRARRGSRTGRCRRTTSRTSRRSTTRSTRSSANPRRQQFKDPARIRYNPADGEPGADAYPYVADDLPADRASHAPAA